MPKVSSWHHIMKRFRQIMIANALAARNRSGGGGPPIVYITLPATTLFDASVIKYDATGTALWATSISGSGDDIGTELVTDSTGIYLSGIYTSTTVLPLLNGDGTTSSFSLPISLSVSNPYIIKYDTSGTVLWAAVVKASSPSGSGGELSVDSTGIYVALRYLTTNANVAIITNGDGTPSSFSLPASTSGAGGIFIIKYSTTGTVLWAASMQNPGTNSPAVSGITTDSGGVYLSGQYFADTSTPLVNGNGTTSSFSLPITTDYDGFLIKYAATTGAVAWVAVINGPGSEGITAVTSDSTGVYVGGNYPGPSSIPLNNADGNPSGFSIASAAGSARFIVKYNSLGVVQWQISSIGNSGAAQSMATDSSGVYAVGRWATSGKTLLVNADGSLSTSFLLNRNTYITLYISKYTSNGVVLWANSIVILGSLNDINLTSVDVTATGVYTTGYYVSTSITRILNPDGSDTGIILPIAASRTGFAIMSSTTTGVVQWVTTTGTELNGVAGDTTGAYATGKYTSATPVTLNNAIVRATPVQTLELGVSSNNGYIVSYTSSGVPVWNASIRPTASSGLANINGFSADSTSLFASGSYVNPTTLPLFNADRSSSGKSLPAIAAASAFITKYSTSGVVQWVAYVPSDGVTSISGSKNAADSTGVYFAGYYTSPSTVSLLNGDGTASSFTLPASSVRRTFLIKYSASGTIIWTTTIGSDAGSGATSIGLHSTDVYLTGSYFSTSGVSLFNADGGDPGKSLPISDVNSSTDTYIIKYNTLGEVQWAATINSTGVDTPSEVTVDSSGIYVTGSYISASAVTLLNADGSNPIKSLPTTTSSDAFVVKYSTSGVVQWAAAIKGTIGDGGLGIATDLTGVYMAGFYRTASTLTLLNADGTPSSVTLPSSSNQDGVVVKYNLTTGAVIWAAVIRGGGNDAGRSVVTDSTGVYITGGYTATAGAVTLLNADGSNSNKILPATPNQGVFTIKYNSMGIIQWALAVDSPYGTDSVSGIGIIGTTLYFAGVYAGAGVFLTNSF
jgi:hypothetical protein